MGIWSISTSPNHSSATKLTFQNEARLGSRVQSALFPCGPPLRAVTVIGSMWCHLMCVLIGTSQMQATCSQNLLKPFWVLKPYLHYFTQSNISPAGSAASVCAITKCNHWIFMLFIVNYKFAIKSAEIQPYKEPCCQATWERGYPFKVPHSISVWKWLLETCGRNLRVHNSSCLLYLGSEYELCNDRKSTITYQQLCRLCHSSKVQTA